MIRIRINNDQLKGQFIIELSVQGWNFHVNNPNGNCFYIWIDGSKRAELSHWTNDNPILDIGKSRYQWVLNCIKTNHQNQEDEKEMCYIFINQEDE
jgi:hypothetical protein